MSALTSHLAPARGWRTRSAAASLSTGTLVGLVIVSRLIVWAAGMAGDEWGRRVAGWRQIDPSGITQSYGHLEDLLLGPVLRWDGLGYLNIAQHGYASRATTIFFPAYPLSMAGLGRVIGSHVIAGWMISCACFAVGLWLLHRLTELELGRRAADATILLLAFAPVSFFFTAIYTESLFLAVSVGALYAARRDRWWLAGLLAAVAAVTRVTGVLLLVPLALWQLHRRRRLGSPTLWLLLPLAALAGFMLFMHTQGYSWLAPYLNQQRARSLAGPWTTVVDGFRAAGDGVSAVLHGTEVISPSLAGPFSTGFDSVVLLLVLGVAIWALLVTFQRLPFAFGAYALAALLVVLATETRIQPLDAVDRYVLTIFPLWMAAGAWLSERRALRPALVIGAALLGFYSFEFATWAFIA
jgi:hypothetical protein